MELDLYPVTTSDDSGLVRNLRLRSRESGTVVWQLDKESGGGKCEFLRIESEPERVGATQKWRVGDHVFEPQRGCGLQPPDVHVGPARRCVRHRHVVTALDYVLGACLPVLARLGTKDSIFDAPRLSYLRAMDNAGHPSLAELAVRPWCISVWIGGAVAVAGYRRSLATDSPHQRWAYSLAAGVINELGAESDDG